MVQLKFAPVETKNLFSRHYLDERLKTLPVWSEGKEEVERVFREIKEIYDREKSFLPKYTEAPLEDNFIRPVLRKLGHFFDVQHTVYEKRMTPDYAFFADDVILRAAKGESKKEFYKMAVAVGDAKKWGTPLDKKSIGKAKYVYDNPSFQIDLYLRNTDAKWGILTDGRYWRLYSQKTSQRLDSYYEADLAGILESGSLQDFKYFYLFFRKDAFVRDALGTTFLEMVQAEGVNYAKKVGEDLEKNVYKALKILGQGFLNWPNNNLTPDAETIKKIHDNSLIFLYRLLFILYADGKGSLSGLHGIGWEHFNINIIKAKAMEKKQSGALAEHSSELWDKLGSLFQLIDEGSEARRIPKDDLFVPPYNGGLFHSKEHAFLAEKKVGDKYVAEVIELLTTPPAEDVKVFIDYSTLEIRHLGSIYEGLLEYKLRVADKDLVATKEKGKEIWVPAEEAEGKKVIDTVKAGELYLATDKNERKATGSYYTPDYIVKYIVENTLGPVVEEKLKEATADDEKLERLLAIKVLDPAMGSGHFLVEATDFLAEKIVPFVKPEQLHGEREIDWARREVVKRCIYGVDLNPLATELAKLSLWLSTFEASRPLSFLDHHLKVGNSLIGVEIYNLDKHPSELKAGEESSQLSLSTFMRASILDSIDTLLNMYNWIVERAEEKIADIKYKEQIFEQLLGHPLRKRFVELANLHTSYYFGNEYTKSDYEEALRAFQDGGEAWNKIRENEYFKRAQEIATEKSFFHWKLEFPEIFFEPGKEKENSGYDAVIGNPPYGASFDSIEKDYIINNFEAVAWRGESYIAFIELALNMCCKSGKTSMIVPDTWMALKFTEDIRTIFFTSGSLRQMVALPTNVFEDAAVDTSIYVLEKKIINKNMQKTEFSSETQVTAYPKDALIDSIDTKTDITYNQLLWAKNPYKIINPHATPYQLQILNKINNLSSPLSELTEIKYGLKAYQEGKGNPAQTRGQVDKKEFTSNVQKNPNFKPFLEGREIYRYLNTWDENNWINWGSWLAEPRSKELFIGERLLFRKIAGKRLTGTYIDKDAFSNTLLYIIKSKDKNCSLTSILSVLNSALIGFFFRFAYSIRDDDLFPQIMLDDISNLPIRNISFTTPENERRKLTLEIKDLYNLSNFAQILSSVNSYLPKDKAGNFISENEKSDVVHDLLAFLAEQMIEMNKAKNKEIKGFFSWLRDVHGIDKEAMKPKTYLDEFYTLEAGAFFKHLEKNKVKPNQQDYGAIKETFEKAASTIRPLVERIERTDRLIDQIVYKLYGLTEEEIKIVEASS